MITPELLTTLKAELVSVFDMARLEAAQQKGLKQAGTREYAWVNRPEIPLLLQAYRDCDSWVAALREMKPPPNLGALGPFVRFGLALQFARRLPGGPERIDELRRHASTADFHQLTNKAFELEVAFYFARTSDREDIAFGPIGANPDLWLAPHHPLAVPVECKVVSGDKRPSRQCLGEWRRFIVWAVRAMKRLKVCAGVCVRANDDFGPVDGPLLKQLTESVLTELSASPKETWALRSDDDGTFLVYGYRLGEWGKPRPPFSVPFGLDGDLAVWVQHDTARNELTNPYFFALKFQSPDIRGDAVVENLKTASDQLERTRPKGPGVVVLKVALFRKGDLLEVDQAVRTALAKRPHVSAALVLRDEAAEVPDKASDERTMLWGFSLRPYLIVNQQARVALGWPDSRPTYFSEEALSVLRAPSGELVPHDFAEERRLVGAGTVIPNDETKPWLIDARGGRVPPFPHVLSEGPDITEPQGRMTFYWRFKGSIASCLFTPNDRDLMIEWFVIGDTHFRLFRDRYLNLRVNRRTSSYQDNIAIDLVPFGRADELLLLLFWDSERVKASLRSSDERPAAVCRSARAPND